MPALSISRTPAFRAMSRPSRVRPIPPVPPDPGRCGIALLFVGAKEEPGAIPCSAVDGAKRGSCGAVPSGHGERDRGAAASSGGQFESVHWSSDDRAHHDLDDLRCAARNRNKTANLLGRNPCEGEPFSGRSRARECLFDSCRCGWWVRSESVGETRILPYAGVAFRRA